MAARTLLLLLSMAAMTGCTAGLGAELVRRFLPEVACASALAEGLGDDEGLTLVAGIWSRFDDAPSSRALSSELDRVRH